MPMPQQPTHPPGALRALAYELADTGAFEDWDSVCADLRDRGASSSLLRQLDEDTLFQIMLKDRMARPIGNA